ncbi:hypothetical protein BC827DRAFT_1209465 [Russula dissimulans]|nr:hypothetical protein BC827DRAFT_1209465 [Russula dissimulans]
MRARILFHIILTSFVNVQGFYVSSTTPTQCGQFHVSWFGGHPPFLLMVVPVFGTQQPFNLSDNGFSDGIGTFNTTLTLPAKQEFVFVMSDATGFATGGISELLTVGPASPGETCNTSQAGGQFYFTTDDTLKECRLFTFSEYPNAIQPVTIYGVVPGGSGIEFNPPIGPDFVWNPANVPANTSMLFYMADAQNRTGGVSGVMVSQATGDSSCINSTSPSSTTGVAVSSTYLSTTTTTSITSPVSRFKRLSAGAISGIVLGGAIGLAGFAALALLFRPWNRKHSASSSVSHRIDIDDEGFCEDLELLSQVEPFPPSAEAGAGSADSWPESTRLASLSSHLSHSPPAETRTVATSVDAFLSPTPSTGSRKGNTRPAAPLSLRRNTSVGTGTRVIVHRDAGEAIHGADEDGVVEIPPIYEDSRRLLFLRAVLSDTPSPGDSSLSS